MKNKVLAILGFLVVAAVVGTINSDRIVDAAGHVGISNVYSYLRTRENRYQVYALDLGANTNDTTAGQSGVLLKEVVGAGSNLTISASSTIAATPYPCKLAIYAKDGDNSGTLTCTGDIVLCGFNQFADPVNMRSGNQMCETLTADVIEGTAIKTSRVYEKLTSFSAAGCSGNTHVSQDVIVVACAPDIGLPFPIKGTGAVVSVCAYDASASNAEFCWTSGSISEDIDVDDSSVAIFENVINTTGVGNDDATLGGAGTLQFNDGDNVLIRVRAPEGR